MELDDIIDQHVSLPFSLSCLAVLSMLISSLLKWDVWPEYGILTSQRMERSVWGNTASLFTCSHLCSFFLFIWCYHIFFSLTLFFFLQKEMNGTSQLNQVFPSWRFYSHTRDLELNRLTVDCSQSHSRKNVQVLLKILQNAVLELTPSAMLEGHHTKEFTVHTQKQFTVTSCHNDFANSQVF